MKATVPSQGAKHLPSLLDSLSSAPHGGPQSVDRPTQWTESGVTTVPSHSGRQRLWVQKPTD